MTDEPKIRYLAEWDTWDNESERAKWIASLPEEPLVDACSTFLVRGGESIYVGNEFTDETGCKRISAYKETNDNVKLHDTREEAVLHNARSNVEYYEGELRKAKEVLAYVERKIAAGELP